MAIVLLVYLGGVLTILSPCILPVLPFIFARSEQRFLSSGLPWAPCAGPILGLILTGAAISGPNAKTSLLLFAYAAGAATSLALALLAGGKLWGFLKKSLGAGEWVRRGLGVAVLLAVIAIVLGWDSSVLTRLSL